MYHMLAILDVIVVIKINKKYKNHRKHKTSSPFPVQFLGPIARKLCWGVLLKEMWTFHYGAIQPTTP